MRVDIQELKAKMAYQGKYQKDVAMAIDMSPNTFCVKLQTGNFKIEEIHKLMKAIPLTKEDVEHIFFAN